MSEPRKMNILLVLADQHQANMFGAAGHPQALTPNFDAFAASGVRFDSAYCQNPICTPSRISILSGQYPHNHGYYGLSGPSHEGLHNLMRHARASGYRTAGFGKLHLPCSPRNWLADDLDVFADTYETADGVRGESAFFEYLRREGVRDLEDSWHNPAMAEQRKHLLWDAEVSPLPYEHTMERWCAREAMRFIDAAPDRPFCIEVAFQRPHHPLLVQQEFWDLYDEDLDLPETWSADPAHRPPTFRKVFEGIRDGSWPRGKPGQTPEQGLRRAWRGTLGCVSQIDDVFGRLMRDLEDRGLAEDTIVIYSSDHGGYHGVHGLPEKAPGICSESVCRVPMFWRVPGVTPAGGVCGQLVESVDVAPTLAKLCGMDPMETADGEDISALLAGGEEPVRSLAVTENPWSKAVRWDRWRYVHYPEGFFDDGEAAGELYDLHADPLERNNLFDDPAHRAVVQEGRRRLLDWLIQTSRIVTTHPAILYGDNLAGRHDYPICSDGRGPNFIQPRRRDDNHEAYL